MKAAEHLLSLAVVLVLAANTRGQQCNREAIQDCIRPLEGDSFTISHGIILHVKQWDESDMRTACNSKVREAAGCLRVLSSACRSIFFFGGALSRLVQIYTDFMYYVCTQETLQGISQHGDCLNKPAVRNSTERCFLNLLDLQPHRRHRHIEDLISMDLFQTIMWYGIHYFCGVLVDVRLCSARNIDQHCAMDTVNFIDGVFQSSIKAVNRMVTCHFEEPLEKYCIPNPCLNQGVCNYTTSEPSIRTCICPPDVNGTLCENVMHDPIVTGCLPDSCLNGGVCNEEEGRLVCACAMDYDGDVCEKRKVVRACQSDTCHNGGSCHGEGTSVRCACPMGYAGDQCGDRITSSTSTPTSSISTSTISPSTPSTLSPTSIPTSTTSDCDNTVCENGGVCRLDQRVPKCVCPIGLVGERCESTLGSGDDGSATNQPVIDTDQSWNVALAIAAIFGVIGVLVAVILSVTGIIVCLRKGSVAPANSQKHPHPQVSRLASVHRYTNSDKSSIRKGGRYLDGDEDSWRNPAWWSKTDVV